MFTPDVRKDPHVVETRNLAGQTFVDEASQDGWNGVCVGGASNVMTGFFLRMKPLDFRQRSELGRWRAPTSRTGRSPTRSSSPTTTASRRRSGSRDAW